MEYDLSRDGIQIYESAGGPRAMRLTQALYSERGDGETFHTPQRVSPYIAVSAHRRCVHLSNALLSGMTSEGVTNTLARGSHSFASSTNLAHYRANPETLLHTHRGIGGGTAPRLSQ